MWMILKALRNFMSTSPTLEAGRIDSNVDMRERAANRNLGLEPENLSAYAVNQTDKLLLQVM